MTNKQQNTINPGDLFTVNLDSSIYLPDRDQICLVKLKEPAKDFIEKFKKYYVTPLPPPPPPGSGLRMLYKIETVPDASKKIWMVTEEFTFTHTCYKNEQAGIILFDEKGEFFFENKREFLRNFKKLNLIKEIGA